MSEHRALFQKDVGDGVEDALAPLHALAVVALYVFHAGMFPEAESVHAVVFRLALSGVVYAASRDYGDVRVLSYEEVVVHRVREVAHRQYHGDVHALVFDAGRNDDVYAGFVRLLDYAYLLGGIGGEAFAVFAYIEAPLRDGVEFGYLFQQFAIQFFHIIRLPSLLSCNRARRRP